MATKKTKSKPVLFEEDEGSEWGEEAERPAIQVEIPAPESTKEKTVSKPSAQQMEKLLREPRMNSVMKGVKEGAMKAAFDKLVSAMADPIKEKVVPALREMGGPGVILEPAVELGISFIFMMGIAEAVAWLAPVAGGMLPGDKKEDMAEKGQLLAEWMREYAGEKVGKDVVDAAVMALPLIMAHFSEFSSSDLKLVLGKEDAQQAQSPLTEAAKIEEEHRTA